MGDLHSINEKDRLYVIKEGNVYSCLGFDVCQDWSERIAKEAGIEMKPVQIGTEQAYNEYQRILNVAKDIHNKRFTCMLTPQLIGLEHKRVEVIDKYGDKRRFWVGKSTGWLPIHLEIKTRRSSGGIGTYGSPYQSVNVIA